MNTRKITLLLAGLIAGAALWKIRQLSKAQAPQKAEKKEVANGDRKKKEDAVIASFKHFAAPVLSIIEKNLPNLSERELAIAIANPQGKVKNAGDIIRKKLGDKTITDAEIKATGDKLFKGIA